MRKLASLVFAVLASCGVLSAQDKKQIAPAFFTITIPTAQAAAGQGSINPLCPGSTTAPHCWIGTWTAPTVHTDNTPIPTSNVLTYDLLRATVTNGTAGAFAPVLTGISALTAEDDTVVGGQTYEYEIVVHEATNPNASLPSAASVAFLVPQAAPLPTSAPTGIVH
jgi:hypothetical protein